MNYIDVKANKTKFITIFGGAVTRSGKQAFLNWLEETDFFLAPASTRYHGSVKGGLCAHSLNVYECMKTFYQENRERFGWPEVSQETMAIVALLHDVCKANCYQPSSRRVKDEIGGWKEVTTYAFKDAFPMGHGEKSAYLIGRHMELTAEEALAIRYHMGFSRSEDIKNVGEVFEKYPLAFALSTADMQATYFLEGSRK